MIGSPNTSAPQRQSFAMSITATARMRREFAQGVLILVPMQLVTITAIDFYSVAPAVQGHQLKGEYEQSSRMGI